MPRFVHIDHSLCRVGGHEYDYAMNILRSVEAGGYQVVLGVNRRFRDRTAIPAHWPVYPVFPHTAHTKHCVSLGGHEHLPIDVYGRRLPPIAPAANGDAGPRRWGQGAAAWGDVRRYVSRRRRITQFARACQRLFQQINLTADDHVFLATVTEFDLLGLTSFLTRHPEVQTGIWHLQFHFDLFAGCGDHAGCRAKRIDVVRRQFRHALDQLPRHRLHFYTTTAELAAQYNQLGVSAFRHLPYPVNPALQRRGPAPGSVLRITCAGGMRREKGIRTLGAIVRRLRDDPFFDGRIEIAAQLPERKLQRLGICDDRRRSGASRIRVVGLPYPLTIDSYHDLIRQTDIGLFLYDHRRYHVRCSGILQEMLAAGKPVIVPAGCWLAEQVAEPIARHIEQLAGRLPLIRRLRATDLAWIRCGCNASEPVRARLRLPLVGADEVRTELPVPAGATELVLAVRRHEPVEAGTYLSVQAIQEDGRGRQLGRFESIVGSRSGNRATPVLLHVDPQAVRVTVVLKNAFQSGNTAVTGFTADFLDSRELGGCPTGSVGLVAADTGCVAEALREMVARYDHYRQTAEAFSRGWLERHHPERTFDILASTGTRLSTAAA